jgi:hypothetical protein
VIQNITIRSFLNLPFPTKTSKYRQKSEDPKKWVPLEKASHLRQETSESAAVLIHGFRIKICIRPGVFELIQSNEWVNSEA